MARDARQLRQEAQDATASGKHKRALAAYLELETLESRDAQWPKRAGETYRRLNRDKDAAEAFTRAADRYAQGGFLVQAIAVCKLILQIDPRHDAALQRIAAMNEQIGAGPTRAASIADNNPNLADNAAVSALRTRNNTSIPLDLDEPRRRKISSSPPMIALPRTRTPPSSAGAVAEPLEPLAAAEPPAPVSRTTTPMGLSVPRTKTSNAQSQLAMARTKSKPITLPPNLGIDSIDLKTEIPEAFEREDSSGIYVIPIDDEDYLSSEPAEPADEEPGAPHVVVEASSSSPIEVEAVDVEESTELELGDLEEIPLPEPRALGLAAAETLAATPLFSGMSQEALEALVAELQLVQLVKGDALFYEGDPGDALYVIVEGDLSVQAEGPPRVEMARLGPGAFLGEVALMTDQPRSATVIALGDAELLRIDRATLSRVLAEHGDILTAVLRFVRERLVDRWTRTSPLFRPFNPQERAALASRFKFLEIEAGRTLLAAGARPDGLYIVLAGHFTVTLAGAQRAMLGPGDLIGEGALLSGGTFKSEVRARGKALALCLPANDFREIIMTHPHVLEYIGEQAEQSRKLQIL
ncbi:MAG TPA: cyclic nucleotide-binding domain-containing protein [Kofleriaceae bacterium]|jgi:CRP-like cAMP-binding protein